jgi:hypothetical protein
MNYVKFLVALAAICVLIIPAFSMPDNGMGKDANQMWQGQDGKQISQGQNNTQKTCGCENSTMGKNDSQKTCGCEKSMMGHDGKQMPPMMGQDGKQMGHKNVKSMMGGREKGGNEGVKLVVININV